MSVYFARVKGYVKIGYSKNPIERQSTITTGSCIKPDDVTYGDDIDLLGWIPGDRKTEKATHKRFASLNVIGEWFWDDDAYDELIEADPFGLPFHDTPWLVQCWMEKYPTISRAAVTRVYEQHQAEQDADPKSVRNQVNSMFGTSLADTAIDHGKRLDEERAADRAFWRSQRSAA